MCSQHGTEIGKENKRKSDEYSYSTVLYRYRLYEYITVAYDIWATFINVERILQYISDILVRVARRDGFIA